MCGIIGLFEKSSMQPSSAFSLSYSSAKKVVKGLTLLQHRGQDAAGILSSRIKDGSFVEKKGPGLVKEVFSGFSENNFEELEGQFLLGHTRYETVGGPSKVNIPPFQVFKKGHEENSLVPFQEERVICPVMGIVHNGNLANYFSLKEELEGSLNKEDGPLEGQNDGELLLRLFRSYFMEVPSVDGEGEEFPIFQRILTSIKKLSEKVDGGYAFLILIEGVGLVAFRDPHGIRPLVLGKGDGGHFCFSSETVALEGMGYQFVREVRPGEVVFVGVDGLLQSSKLAYASSSDEGAYKESPCMFERVYFSSAKSKVKGATLKNTRRRLGTLLAEKIEKQNKAIGHYDAVSAIPETGLDAAFGVAQRLNLPLIEGVQKEQKSGRSFILPRDQRKLVLKRKFIIKESEIKNKRLLLVDDSLVRGATLKSLILELKNKGAKELSLAFSCPPIKFGCFYGVDFPDKDELLASGRNNLEMATFLGVKDLFFLHQQDLLKAFNGQSHCFGCVTKMYPTKLQEGSIFAQKRAEEKGLLGASLGPHY